MHFFDMPELFPPNRGVFDIKWAAEAVYGAIGDLDLFNTNQVSNLCFVYRFLFNRIFLARTVR